MILEACGAEISSIILGIVEDQLKAKLKEINEQKIFKDLKGEVYNKIGKLMHENDGSILTSQAFSRYLKYDKPIEKIFTAFLDLESEICGVDELTERLYLECITRIEEKGTKISTTEKGLIKDFFQIVIEVIYRKSRERKMTLPIIESYLHKVFKRR